MLAGILVGLIMGLCVSMVLNSKALDRAQKLIDEERNEDS